jgi:hypothetical protein
MGTCSLKSVVNSPNREWRGLHATVFKTLIRLGKFFDGFTRVMPLRTLKVWTSESCKGGPYTGVGIATTVCFAYLDQNSKIN